MNRNNRELNAIIERFIDVYDGTIIGYDVKNMYENGTSYEKICEKIDIDYEEYVERDI